MTMSMKANAAGTQAEILLNGSTVATLTQNLATFSGGVKASAGGVTFPDGSVQDTAAYLPPAFAAKSAAPQSCGQQVWTSIIFGSELLDTNNAYNPATGIFTAPISGWYQCDWFVEFSPATNTITVPSVFSNVLKNSVPELTGGSTAIGGNGSTTAGSGLVQCSVGDQLNLRVFQENSAAAAVNASGRFSSYLVRKVP